MLDVFKKKAKGAYDTEYFKNKVLISDLEEKQKLQSQRNQIANLRKKLEGKKGIGVAGFMQGLGDFGQNAEYAIMGTLPRKKGKQKQNYGGMF